MSLSESQRKILRGLAHELKPVVMVAGGGASEGVLRELEQALAHHELLKVRVRVGDRELRDELIGRLCASTGAELVQRIGNVATLYRRNPEKPKIVLSA